MAFVVHAHAARARVCVHTAACVCICAHVRVVARVFACVIARAHAHPCAHRHARAVFLLRVHSCRKECANKLYETPCFVYMFIDMLCDVQCVHFTIARSQLQIFELLEFCQHTRSSYDCFSFALKHILMVCVTSLAAAK